MQIMLPHLVLLGCRKLRAWRIFRVIPILSAHLITALVIFCKFCVMTEQHVWPPPNAKSETGVLFTTVFLRGLSRLRLRYVGRYCCFLWFKCFRRFCGGKPCLTMEAPDTSSTSTGELHSSTTLTLSGCMIRLKFFIVQC